MCVLKSRDGLGVGGATKIQMDPWRCHTTSYNALLRIIIMRSNADFESLTLLIDHIMPLKQLITFTCDCTLHISSVKVVNFVQWTNCEVWPKINSIRTLNKFLLKSYFTQPLYTLKTTVTGGIPFWIVVSPIMKTLVGKRFELFTFLIKILR